MTRSPRPLVLRQFGPAQITRDPRAVVTTGTFDGVHTGHQAIVRYLVEHAQQTGGVATVVSFDPHPREVLSAQRIPLLTTLAERADAFEALGLDRFVVLPFTRDLSLLEPEAYVQEVLLDTVGLREI
ncbi:MAG: bifunctional riboflavin kinase/FAD synthetase, partial [Bacteroidota bacterium]